MFTYCIMNYANKEDQTDATQTSVIGKLQQKGIYGNSKG